MGDENPRPQPNRIEVELRNLEGLLRKKLGNNLIVEGFTTSSLVPPGENYGSTMLRVEAEVRRDGPKSELEKLSLVAKMTPATEYQRKLFDSPSTFRQEIYMFTDIIPAYKALELECGIPETEVFDPLPKLYGSRLSLDEGEDKFDEDAVILMENLKVKKYACGDRKIGVDLRHAKSVIETLAHFHALGIAVKLKKPELFKEFKTRAKANAVTEEAKEPIIQFLISSAKKIPVLLPYLPRIEKVLFRPESELFFTEPVEPWGTIVHRDLWVNNVMFRDDENGNPEGVKLVDFQIYSYQNPLRDLVFFLFTSCQKELRAAHIEDLVDFYYEKFSFHLARLKCDSNLFSRDSFNEQFADAVNLEYTHCAFMTWVAIMEVESDSERAYDPEMTFQLEATDEFCKRFAEISLIFINKNWI